MPVRGGQKQTDSGLASPPVNRHSPGQDSNGPPIVSQEAAAPKNKIRIPQGMTDQPLYHQPLSGSDRRPSPGRIRRLRRLIRHIPLIGPTVAAYYCARDSRTPFGARVALFGALGYFVMPFDLIPDFIPGIGHLDDAAVMLLALRLVAHRITPEHRESARTRIDAWVG
jgi:uncharacterized membrane protein YkvA (DUF1232 family)